MNRTNKKIIFIILLCVCLCLLSLLSIKADDFCSNFDVDLVFVWEFSGEKAELGGFILNYKTITLGDPNGPPYDGTGVDSGDSPVDTGDPNNFTFTLRGVSIYTEDYYLFTLQSYPNSDPNNKSDHSNEVRWCYDFSLVPESYIYSDEVSFDSSGIITVFSDSNTPPSSPKDIFWARQGLTIPAEQELVITFIGYISEDGRAPISLVLENLAGEILDERTVTLDNISQLCRKSFVFDSNVTEEVKCYVYCGHQKATYNFEKIVFHVGPPGSNPVIQVDGVIIPN